jgi:hypothetical protein
MLGWKPPTTAIIPEAETNSEWSSPLRCLFSALPVVLPELFILLFPPALLILRLFFSSSPFLRRFSSSSPLCSSLLLLFPLCSSLFLFFRSTHSLKHVAEQAEEINSTAEAFYVECRLSLMAFPFNTTSSRSRVLSGPNARAIVRSNHRTWESERYGTACLDKNSKLRSWPRGPPARQTRSSFCV